jgi:hypothetical protein
LIAWVGVSDLNCRRAPVAGNIRLLVSKHGDDLSAVESAARTAQQIGSCGALIPYGDLRRNSHQRPATGSAAGLAKCHRSRLRRRSTRQNKVSVDALEEVTN